MKQPTKIHDYLAEDIKQWRQSGEYYGYPECCIQDFLNRATALDYHYPTDKNASVEISPEQDSVHKNYGFIPCHECAKKIIWESTTLEGLIKDRKCPNPFPIEEDGYDPRKGPKEAIECDCRCCVVEESDESQYFEVTKEQQKKISEWKDAIKLVFDEYGEFDYTFHHTGIGTTLSVYSHIAYKEKDFTDYDNW